MNLTNKNMIVIYIMGIILTFPIFFIVLLDEKRRRLDAFILPLLCALIWPIAIPCIICVSFLKSNKDQNNQNLLTNEIV
jgi:hypothetical protein